MGVTRPGSAAWQVLRRDLVRIWGRGFYALALKEKHWNFSSIIVVSRLSELKLILHSRETPVPLLQLQTFSMDSELSPLPSCARIDNSFGPWAGECRGGFDFTLLFEETIMTIGPLAILLIFVPFRVSYLFKKSPKASSGVSLPLKLVSPVDYLPF